MESVERWARMKKRIEEWWKATSDVRFILDRIMRWLLASVGFLIRLVAAGALVYLAYRVVYKHLDTGAAAAAGGLVFAGAFVLILSPRFRRALLQRMSKVSVGPVGVEWTTGAVAGAKVEAEDPEWKEKPPTSVLDLQSLLEAKLAYIAKDLLNDQNGPAFVTLGSLGYDGYMSKGEAKTLLRLMALRDEDLDLMSTEERQRFLKTADKIVGTVRATVLFGMVRKLITEAKEPGTDKASWEVVEIPRAPRPDLLVTRGNHRFHVVTAFGTAKDSKIRDDAVKRLKAATRPREVTRRIVVLPHKTNADTQRCGPPSKATTDRISVVTTDQILEELKDPCTEEETDE